MSIDMDVVTDITENRYFEDIDELDCAYADNPLELEIWEGMVGRSLTKEEKDVITNIFAKRWLKAVGRV